jgi:hypothetical protein
MNDNLSAQMAHKLLPAEFSSQYLWSMDASEGRRKRRKRDTTPDAIGLSLKRELLEAAISAAPAPNDFESWLMAQALSDPASGPRLAMAAEILADYRMACLDPRYSGWLAQGAPSADADTDDTP